MSRGITRRGLTVAGVSTVVAIVLAASLWLSFAPDVTRYMLGPLEDFAPGTVTSFISDGDRLAPFTEPGLDPGWGWSGDFEPPEGELVHVVRLPDGELFAFAGVSPHRGQPVLWFSDATTEVTGPARGFFGDDFSWWLVDGSRVFGPTPRDLPRYDVEVDADGIVTIDLREPVPGSLRVGSDAVAASLPGLTDVTNPGWPASRWTGTNR